MIDKTNVHIYPSSLKHASRILKITKTLASSKLFSRILIIGIWAQDMPERESFDKYREIIRLKGWPLVPSREINGLFKKVISFAIWYLQVLSFLSSKPVACINAHSLSVLPLCVIVKKWKKCLLVYDTHELETETTTSRGIRKNLSKFVEKNLMHHVDETIVVSESIRKWYMDKYGLPRVWVVKNIPSVSGYSSSPVSLKKALGIPERSLLFLYLGYVSPGRGIHQMLDIFAKAKQDRHILFMGDGALAPVIKDFSSKFPNIHYLPSVPPDEVVAYAAGADIGICPLENSSLSDYFSLPNKLFEYILAGLPVCINDFPDQRDFVEFHDCGWVLEDSIESFVSFLNDLSAEMISQKRAGVRKAQESLSWENEATTYIKAVKSAIAGSSKKPAQTVRP